MNTYRLKLISDSNTRQFYWKMDTVDCY